MPSNITAFEAKNRLGRLLDRVQGGEEITITRHGNPVARLVPIITSDPSGVERALATFKRIRQTLAKQGVKVTRQQMRDWVNEGRH